MSKRFWSQFRVIFALVQFDTALVVLIGIAAWRGWITPARLTELLIGLVALSRVPAAIAMRKRDSHDDDDPPSTKPGGIINKSARRGVIVTSILLTLIVGLKAWADVVKGGRRA